MPPGLSILQNVDVRQTDARRPEAKQVQGVETLQGVFLAGRGSLEEHIMCLDFAVILHFTLVILVTSAIS